MANSSSDIMSHYLKTDLVGKVNNLKSFKNEALLPVFEAISNSIHAIEEKGNLSDGVIIVRVTSSGARQEFARESFQCSNMLDSKELSLPFSLEEANRLEFKLKAQRGIEFSVKKAVLRRY